MIKLCVCVTLIEMLVCILIAFFGGMVKVRGILKKECYKSFAWRRNYVCQIHSLGERKRGR